MNNKQYIIPTNQWLVPLSKYITDDISTRGLLMLANYMNHHKVVVKITKNGNYKKIKKICKTLSDHMNFVKTITVITCDESDINLENNYENIKGFCIVGDSNTNIILEIMVKYNCSLNDYIKDKILTYEIIRPILKQLLLAQLHAFDNYGFVHMDMHLGNILVYYKKDKMYKIIYKIAKRTYMIDDNIIYAMSDYDKSILLTLEDTPTYNDQNILIINLMNTFKMFKHLLDKNYYNIIDKHFNDDNEYVETERSYMRTLYRKTRDQEDYTELVIVNATQFIDNIWIDLYNEHLFSHCAL